MRTGVDALPDNGVKSFEDINADKVDLYRLYEASDPRSYYGNLGALDYIIPQVANPIFQQLVEARRALTGRPVKVLDLGASYGINGELLRFPITWDMLRNRYQIADTEHLSPSELQKLDRHYYQAWPRDPNVEVLAQDVSEPALRFAEQTGSVDRGFAVNLEERDPDPEMAAALRDVDLVISTGAVGYISEETFARVLACNQSRPAPWVASFVLRMYPYARIAQALTQFDLETEKLEGATFIQRRFADKTEMDAMMAKLRDDGIATAGKEDLGYMHAELFVSRPADQVAQTPLSQLVSVASGAQRVLAGPMPRVNVVPVDLPSSLAPM